jgi:hypothetical protein
MIRCAALALVVSLVACGGSDAPAPGDPVDAWYAVATNVFLPDGVIGHVVGTSTLEEQELTLAASVEISGGGMVHSAGDGRLFVGPFDSPIYTRYDVRPDGSLAESGRLSFANLGISSAGFSPNAVQFVAPDRAYILTAYTIIVWNPSDLAIVAEIPMPDLKRDGYEVGVGYTTFRRGDQIVWTLQWNDFVGDRVLAETALAILDTTTDTVAVTTVTGCGGAVWGAEGADGTIYWSSGAYEAAAHRLSSGARAAAPCLVRLPPGASQLSSDVVPLSTWTGDRIAGSLWGVSAGRATLRVFDEARHPITGDMTSADLTFRAPWSWQWVDLATGQLQAIDQLAENGGSVFTFDVGDRTLVPAIPVTEDSTVLWDVTAGQGSPVRSIATPGNVYAAVRAL